MPRLVRLYIIQSIIGFALSGVFVGLLLWFNIANLWHLVSQSGAGILAGVLLWLFNGIVFASVQFGIAVMRMAEDDTPGGGKRQPEPLRPLTPSPVAAPVATGPGRGPRRG